MQVQGLYQRLPGERQEPYHWGTFFTLLGQQAQSPKVRCLVLVVVRRLEWADGWGNGGITGRRDRRRQDYWGLEKRGTIDWLLWERKEKRTGYSETKTTKQLASEATELYIRCNILVLSTPLYDALLYFTKIKMGVQPSKETKKER